jgi:hypothetical protein
MNRPASNALPGTRAALNESRECFDGPEIPGEPAIDYGLPRRRIPDAKGKSTAGEAAAGGEVPRCAELGGIRGEMFRHLREGAVRSFRDQLPQYAGTLERLLRAAAGNPVEQLRLESDHRMFFEQVKAVLVTERIQLRLELERVKASRRYGREGASPARSGWEG